MKVVVAIDEAQREVVGVLEILDGQDPKKVLTDWVCDSYERFDSKIDYGFAMHEVIASSPSAQAQQE